MESRALQQNFIDLSDTDTSSSATVNLANKIGPGGTITSDQPDLINIFADEIEQRRLKSSEKQEILEEEAAKPQQQAPPPPARQSCCSIDYYQYYFDVDTKLFTYRFLSSLWPFTSKPFLRPPPDTSIPESPDSFKNRHDVYGAFWIPTTLIAVLTLASYTLHQDNQHLSRLISITYVTYIFLFMVPLAFFCVVKLGVAGEEAHERAQKLSFFSLLCVYGYSFTAFLIPGVLSVLRLTILKWILLGLATFTSLFMLNKEFGEIVGRHGQQLENRVIVLRVLVVLFQAGFALIAGFWFISQ